MKILADENVEAPIIRRLRDDGHEVTSIAETESGIDDVAVLARAVQLQVLLLTGDKDFGDLLFLHRLQSPLGVILVRLPEMVFSSQKAAIISTVFQTYAAQLPGSFTVITPTSVRITSLPPPTK